MRTLNTLRLASASLALACLLALGALAASPALAAQARDASLVAVNTSDKAPDLAREAEVARQQRLQEARVHAARGRQALAAGRYAEARDAFRQAVRLNPDDATCRRLLDDAEAALALGPNHAALLDRVKERMAFQAKSLLAQIDLDLFDADRALAAKDYAEAVRRSEAALANARYVDDAARAAAACKRAEKTLAAARAGCERTAPLSPKKTPGRGPTDQARAADPGAVDSHSAPDPSFPDTKAGAKERRARAHEFLSDLNDEIKPPDTAKVILSGKDKAVRSRVLERPMEPWERELRAKLAQNVSVDFRETPLPEAVHQLRTLGHINVVLDPKAAGLATPVTFATRGRMPLEAALRWVARVGGLQYCLRDGAVLLTTRGGVLQEPIQKVYDVSTFLAEVEDPDPLSFVGPMEPGAPHLTGPRKQAEVVPENVGQSWADFIRTTIATGTWDGQGVVLGAAAERPPFTIAYRNGRIVVVHTPEVHEQIDDLLNNFRRARNLQVHVQARFLFLSRACVEQLSMGYTYDSLLGPTDHSRTVAAVDNQTQVSNLARFTSYDTTGGLNLTVARMGDSSVQAFLNAVLKNMNGIVLQAPRLTMFNTQRANLQVLTNHNYIRRVTGDDEPEIGNIPEGMIFDVQPFVSADRRYITLVLQPQQRELVSLIDYHFLTRTLLTESTTNNINVLTPYEVHIQIPTTRLRSIGTTVTIPNGGTLFVAGFAEIEENSGVATIPFVDSIPVLREVFRGWDRNEGRRSLVILVSAQTVSDIFEE